MIRLYIFVEGQTEEAFVKSVLAPHLLTHGILSTIPLLAHGGVWKTWARIMRRTLAEHKGRDVRFSTLLDLYGLPRGFPDIEALMAMADTRKRVEAVQQAIGDIFDDDRLVPYVQRHEFESLVLAGLDEIGWILGDDRGLHALRAAVGDAAPEDVNDGSDSAPSKRLKRHILGYDKVLHGEMVTSTIGLATLRTRCPAFGRWLTTLEGLARGGCRA